MNKCFLYCDIIMYAVNLVIHIIINKIVFNYDLIVCPIYLYIIKLIYLCYLDKMTEIKA